MRRLIFARMIGSVFLGLLGASALAQQNGIELDFDYFKNEVQPVFLAKRDGNIRCIQCHTRSSGFRIQALEEHRLFFTEEQSRMNFESASQFVLPGADPLQRSGQPLRVEDQVGHEVRTAPAGQEARCPPALVVQGVDGPDQASGGVVQGAYDGVVHGGGDVTHLTILHRACGA